MAKLMVVVTVVARDGIIGRSSVRLEGVVDAGKVVTTIAEISADLPYELKVLRGVATVVDEMAAAGVSGAVFVADGVLPRLLQARKLIDRHNSVDIMILPWMKKDGREEEYRETFTALLASLRRAKNRDITVVFHSTKELWKVRLEGAEGLAGTTVDIRNGISEEFGVRVVGNDRFAGKIIVRESVEKGSTVAYGEIVVDSLVGRAKSFIGYGREAMAAAMALLPEFTVRETTVEIGGNF